MKILCDSGLVTGRREGKWMHYSICCDEVEHIRGLIKELLPTENIAADYECKEE